MLSTGEEDRGEAEPQQHRRLVAAGVGDGAGDEQADHGAEVQHEQQAGPGLME